MYTDDRKQEISLSINGNELTRYLFWYGRMKDILISMTFVCFVRIQNHYWH